MRKLAATTLVEVLLYIAIAGTVTGGIAGLYVSTVRHSRRADAIAMVENEIQFALQKIQHYVHNASAVSSPGVNGTSSNLSLTYNAGTVSLTTASNRLMLTEGGNQRALTGTSVIVSAFTVTHNHPTAAGATYSVQITARHSNPSNDPVANYQQTYVLTITPNYI